MFLLKTFGCPEAGHHALAICDPVAKVSIIPRSHFLQSEKTTFFAPSEERLESGLYNRSYLENQMAVALGGRHKLH